MIPTRWQIIKDPQGYSHIAEHLKKNPATRTIKIPIETIDKLKDIYKNTPSVKLTYNHNSYPLPLHETGTTLPSPEID